MNITEALKTLKSQCNELSTYGANPVLKQAIEVLVEEYEQLKANQPARCSECEYFTGELPHSCGENNGYCEHPVFGNSCCGSITCIDRYCNYGKTESEVTNNE